MRSRLAAVGASALVLGLLAGCGGGDAASNGQVAGSSAAPLVSQPTPPGEVVRPGPGTPKRVAAALVKGKPMVVAFFLPGAADDDAVRQALRQARSSAAGRGVTFFVYTLDQSKRFGDLPELLDVTLTPAVAVIGRDQRLVNLFRGLVDAELLQQAMGDAKDTEPVRRPAPSKKP